MIKRTNIKKQISSRETKLRKIQAFIRRNESCLHLFHHVCFELQDNERDELILQFPSLLPPPPPPSSPVSLSSPPLEEECIEIQEKEQKQENPVAEQEEEQENHPWIIRSTKTFSEET